MNSMIYLNSLENIPSDSIDSFASSLSNRTKVSNRVSDYRSIGENWSTFRFISMFGTFLINKKTLNSFSNYWNVDTKGFK